MRRRRRPSGFSLIELMIALVLMSLIITGITSLVLGAGRSQSTSARVSVAQGGVRAALEFMTRDVTSASAGASTGTIVLDTGTVVQNLIGTTTPMPIYVTTNWNGKGSDRIDLLSINAGVRATVLAPYNGGTQITVDSAASFKVGDRIQICDLANGMLLKVTGFGTNAGFPTLVVTAPTNPLPGSGSFAAGAYVFKSRAVSYYLTAYTPPKGDVTTILWMNSDWLTDATDTNAEPLAEGIEDLQVALGFDNSGDGIIQSLGAGANDDEWVFNVANDTPNANDLNLRTVRVTLVARTTTAEVGIRGQRPPAEDHLGAAAPDGYPRRVVTSEIAVRNFNL